MLPAPRSRRSNRRRPSGLAVFVMLLTAFGAGCTQGPAPDHQAGTAPTLATPTPEETARAYLAEIEADPKKRPGRVLATDEPYVESSKLIRDRFARDSADPSAPVKGLTELLLHDPSPSVRQRAADLLGVLKDAAATEALIQALKDPNEEVRAEACSSLGRIRDRRAVDPLIKVLEDDSSPLVRLYAVQALEDVPNQRAVPVLAKILRSDPNEQLRWNAADTLGSIGGPDAAAALRNALTEKSAWVRARSEDSLEKLGLLILPLPDEVYKDIDFQDYQRRVAGKEVKRETKKGKYIYFETEQIIHLGHAYRPHRNWYRTAGD